MFIERYAIISNFCAHAQVVSVNFHPFYRNVEEVVKKEVFQVNYSSVIVQQDIFAQKTENLRMVREIVNCFYVNAVSVYCYRQTKLSMMS